MTATINASTSAGVVTTADTSGILQLQTNGTAALTVDASQNTTIAGTLTTTGVTTFAAGSAAAPAITTTGDTNTGIFFPAADTIAFAEGGVEAMRIDSSGNVGIGTSSPGATLDVAGNARSNAWIGRANGSAPTADAAIYRAADNTLAFSTGNTERARIDSSGTLLVGATTTPETCRLGVTHDGNVIFGIVVNNTSAVSQSETALRLRRNGAGVGSINTTLTATSYNTSSDYRLKEAIAPMTGALARVALLKPVTYKWKVDGSDGQGFIAHELAEVEAGCVTGEKDAVDAEGKPQYQGIDTSFLIATLTAAIQEQQTLITALTARITALEQA